jgi:transcriptional regulator GlxA family with amidase domain
MRQQALSLGQEMFQEIEEQGPDWEVITRLCLAHLLVLLRRQWELSSSSPDPNSARAGSLGRVMPAVALVNANPGRRIAWHQAAAACALSPSRFSFVFHQAMGVSFERFCRRTRLAYVAHLLLTTSVPVTAIADQTDFVDASCPCQPPMEPL